MYTQLVFMQNKLVLFDIDGTLVDNNRGYGRGRFSHAVKQVFGLDITFNFSLHHGSVDRKVYTDELLQAGLSQEKIDENLDDILFHAHEKWEEIVSEDEYKKCLLSGGAHLLEKLQSKVYLGLLTGNQAKTGWKKIEILGLKKYFSFGVFGHDATNRIEMAKKVPSLSRAHFGFTFNPQNVFVIGDTPWDVKCGQAIEAKTIAVTTGMFEKLDLEKAEADLVVDSLNGKKVLQFILK